MLKTKSALFLASFSVLMSGQMALAQENLNHYSNLETATQQMMRFDSNDENSEPFSLQELGLIPVETTAGIASSELVKAYLRGVQQRIFLRVLPNETGAVNQAKADLAPLEKLFKKNGKRYRTLAEKYDKAKNGYWVQDYRTVTTTNIGTNGQMTIGFTSVPDGKHFVQPDASEASRIEPLLKNEETKLGQTIDMVAYRKAQSTWVQAELNFNKATDSLLDKSGTKYATAEARALRSELRPIKIFRFAANAAEVYFIINTVAQVGVILDGRHPGLFPTIPLAQATTAAIQDFYLTVTK